MISTKLNQFFSRDENKFKLINKIFSNPDFISPDFYNERFLLDNEYFYTTEKMQFKTFDYFDIKREYNWGLCFKFKRTNPKQLEERIYFNFHDEVQNIFIKIQNDKFSNFRTKINKNYIKKFIDLVDDKYFNIVNTNYSFYIMDNIESFKVEHIRFIKLMLIEWLKDKYPEFKFYVTNDYKIYISYSYTEQNTYTRCKFIDDLNDDNYFKIYEFFSKNQIKSFYHRHVLVVKNYNCYYHSIEQTKKGLKSLYNVELLILDQINITSYENKESFYEYLYKNEPELYNIIWPEKSYHTNTYKKSCSILNNDYSNDDKSDSSESDNSDDDIKKVSNKKYSDNVCKLDKPLPDDSDDDIKKVSSKKYSDDSDDSDDEIKKVSSKKYSNDSDDSDDEIKKVSNKKYSENEIKSQLPELNAEPFIVKKVPGGLKLKCNFTFKF